MNDDLYKILGVTSSASLDEIKVAYRRLAQKCHPDKHQEDQEKESEFMKIAAAYKILKNSKKRKLYDDTGATTAPDSIEAKGIAMFVQQVSKTLIQKPEPDSYSYREPKRNFSTVRDKIKEIIGQLKNDIKNSAVRISELNNINQTIINKTDPLNLIKNRMDEIIGDLIQIKKSKEEQIEVSKFAIEYCDHYELLGDSPQLEAEQSKAKEIKWSSQHLVK